MAEIKDNILDDDMQEVQTVQSFPTSAKRGHSDDSDVEDKRLTKKEKMGIYISLLEKKNS